MIFFQVFQELFPHTGITSIIVVQLLLAIVGYQILVKINKNNMKRITNEIVDTIISLLYLVVLLGPVILTFIITFKLLFGLVMIAKSIVLMVVLFSIGGEFIQSNITIVVDIIFVLIGGVFIIYINRVLSKISKKISPKKIPTKIILFLYSTILILIVLTCFSFPFETALRGL